MTAAELTAAVLWLGTVIYAIFGGADFGAGVWDLTAGEGPSGDALRAQIDRSLAPVWEANHTWLIFDLVILWSGFSGVFAAIMTTLYLPLALALVGIVLRGSGFAFRKVTRRLTGRRLFGISFALSSALTPFFLGTVIGAIASGRVPPGGNGDPFASWLNPTSLIVGALAVAAGAYVAGAFLIADARRDQPAIVDAFRYRTLGAGIVAGGLAIAGLLIIRVDAPQLFSGLTGLALPLVVISVVAGTVSLALCAFAGGRWTRFVGVVAAGSIIVGWGVAQYPLILPPSLTISAAAAPEGTIVSLLVIATAAAVIIGPSIGLLFWLQQQGQLVAEPAAEPGQEPAGTGSGTDGISPA